MSLSINRLLIIHFPLLSYLPSYLSREADYRLLLYFFSPNPQNSPKVAWAPTDVPMAPYYIERAYLRQAVRFIANGTVQALRF